MRVAGFLTYFLLLLLVIRHCEALHTGSGEIPLLRRAGSPSPPKSPPRTTHSPGSPQGAVQSHHPRPGTAVRQGPVRRLQREYHWWCVTRIVSYITRRVFSCFLDPDGPAGDDPFCLPVCEEVARRGERENGVPSSSASSSSSIRLFFGLEGATGW